MDPRPVTFLTDFGYSDEYPGACRLVIAGIDPRIRVIEISHGIPPGDVRRGALALAAAVRFSPPAVHLAVVDPGAGGSGKRSRSPGAGHPCGAAVQKTVRCASVRYTAAHTSGMPSSSHASATA